MPPTYYRGCWHVVSRGFLARYRHAHIIPYMCYSSLVTELYNPKTVFVHAALLGQACAHCRKFPTAASRRSLGRVSVPMWPFTLSGRLCIIALVGRYLTNQLMHRKPIYLCFKPLIIRRCLLITYPVLAPVSRCYPSPCRQVAYVLLTRSPLAKSSKLDLARSTCMY